MKKSIFKSKIFWVAVMLFSASIVTAQKSVLVNTSTAKLTPTAGNQILRSNPTTLNLEFVPQQDTKKCYYALITQQGTNAPTANVLNSTNQNYFGDIVWTRISEGFYKGSSPNIGINTWFNGHSIGQMNASIKYGLMFDSGQYVISITCTGGNYQGDYVLNGTCIEIINF